MPDFPTIVTSRRVVPNQFPLDDSPCPYRIAIVGEAPGEDEEQGGMPFIGRSGALLKGELQDAGIDWKKCFIGNVCQVRPPQNEITRFEWKGNEIQSGLTQLSHDLDKFQPNISILLGNTPLRAARQDPNAKVSSWCGSLFLSSFFGQRKCISGFHPSGILRFWGADGNFPRFKAALIRGFQEGATSELILPSRELITHLDAGSLCHIMDNWPAGQRCSLDIEGGLPNICVNDGVRADSKKRRYIGWRCVALSARPSKAFAIAWWKFDPREHSELLRSFARLMARVDVPKVLQNSLYDAFVLEYGYGIPVRNIVEDTMIKMWEQYAELPKSLSVGASIYTREPHWKDEEMYETTGENLAVGCCRDVAVTIEICNALDSCIKGRSMEHYRKNMDMTLPARFMMLRGIQYDQVNVARRKKEVSESGWSVVKDSTVINHRSLIEVAAEINQLCGKEMRGKKGSLSSTRLARTLYTTPLLGGLGYEPQYKKENGRKTTKYTTDVEAILHLQKKLPQDTLLKAILTHRHLEGLLETLSIVPDSDGRVRCSYNVVGTETGRFSCKTSPTGSGANLTTITKSLRENYVSDPGYSFFQCDLEGADGWTVAAHCARLGDPTMWDDYKFGLKPAKIIGLLYLFGPEVNQLSREDIKFWTNGTPWKTILKLVGDWLYTGCKKTQHGTNYLMGIPTMLTTIMKDSFKESGIPVYMEHSAVKEMQDAYFSRYPGIKLWHNWCQSVLVKDGELVSASGQKRIFFGRRFGKDIHETLKEFLSHEPQSNTTWSTNLAMLNLWNDPENRVASVDNTRFLVRSCAGTVHYWSGPIGALGRIVPGSLLIEPLHQVHDALAGQYPTFLAPWAIPKIKSYFQNELTIAGRKIIIPFEMGIGKSWGDLEKVA